MSEDDFEKIVSQHYEQLYRFAFSLTHVEADAWDLTQQTFYIWSTKGHQLRDVSKAKTWLFTTLHRAFLAGRRKQVRFPHHELTDSESELPVVTAETPTGIDSAEALQALGRIDEIYRGAVALFYLEDCSYLEIADILQIPTGTVKSRISRGLEQLRHILLSESKRGRAEI